jgi:hypothetical protein
VRGGAIPVLAWGTLLLVLFIGNWIADDKGVNPAVAGFASGVIYVIGLLLWLLRRDAIRRGPPRPRADPEPLPTSSLGAAGLGLSLGCALFGIVWSKFLLYLGVAMFVVALGRIAMEVRAERMTRPLSRREEEGR